MTIARWPSASGAKNYLMMDRLPLNFVCLVKSEYIYSKTQILYTKRYLMTHIEHK